MKLRLWPWVGLMSGLGFACATGSTDFGDSGSGGDATSGTASSGSTSSGTSTSASSASGAGGAASSSSSGSAGGSGGAGGQAPMCSESPCKLVAPQCGCDPGEQCSYSAASGMRVCVPEGNTPWKEPCSIVAKCGPGLLCVNRGTTSVCGKMCDDDSQCGGPGGLCIGTLVDQNQNPIPGLVICTESCEPAGNTGCSAAAGTACQIGVEAMGQMRTYTVCLPAGNGSQGASCADTSDCAPTFGCFNTGVNNECLKWCKTSSPLCPAGTTCIDIPDANGNPLQIGNEIYGICI